MLATSPDVIVPFRGQRRHKRAIVSQSDFLERRHNIARIVQRPELSANRCGTSCATGSGIVAWAARPGPPTRATVRRSISQLFNRPRKLTKLVDLAGYSCTTSRSIRKYQ